MAERCQLFVIVALGETVLASGATLADAATWNVPVVLALLAAFVGTLAMWWLYFGTSSKDATAAIMRSDDPGRIGAYFHYVHAILIAGVIASAVGNDLVLAHPHAHPSTAQVAILLAGPAIYLLGSAIYKRIVYGVVPVSHLAGVLMLLALVPVAFFADMLVMGCLTTAVVLMVSFCEGTWFETVAGRRGGEFRVGMQSAPGVRCGDASHAGGPRRSGAILASVQDGLVRPRSGL